MINLHDYERAALRTLPPAVADYYAGGAADECSLRADGAAYAALRLLPRVLRDVSERDLATALLGVPLAAPVIIAPTAFQALAHPAGEVATARAAARCGTLMTLSTLSTQPMEAVGAAGAPWWFQLYVYRDRAVTRALVERARAAGAQALVLTVDNQVFGPRERDQRNRFALPPGLQPVNLQADRDIGVLPAGASGSALAAYAARTFDPALAWTDLEWLVADAGLPVVVKGILRADDAQRAAACGAAAVWVSNHGGRQLDTALPPIEALPAIAARLGGAMPLIVDGGIRRGTDVVKALALGADVVAPGRPLLWGLAHGGAAGAARVLELLHHEFDVAMALCGARRPAELDAGLIAPRA